MKVHRRMDFWGHECSDWGMGGSAVIRMLFGFVNPYKILDDKIEPMLWNSVWLYLMSTDRAIPHTQYIFEPSCAYARWALKSRFLSVCLDVTIQKCTRKKIISLEVFGLYRFGIICMVGNYYHISRWAHTNVKLHFSCFFFSNIVSLHCSICDQWTLFCLEVCLNWWLKIFRIGAKWHYSLSRVCDLDTSSLKVLLKLVFFLVCQKNFFFGISQRPDRFHWLQRSAYHLPYNGRPTWILVLLVPKTLKG